MRLRPLSSSFIALGAMCVLLSAHGCSSSSSTNNPPADSGTTTDTGSGSEAGGVITDPDCPGTVDPLNPPAECGPNGIPVCDKGTTTDVSTCGTIGTCLAETAQSGGVSNLRMGVIRLYAPQVLLSVATIAVNPAVQPACMGGNETFNWIMKIDTKANTIQTGGAKYATDHVTYSFLDGQSVTSDQISAACQSSSTSSKTYPVNFDAGPAGTKVDLSSMKANLKLTNGKYASDTVPLLNVPIYPDTKPTTFPIILPLSNAQMKDVIVSPDGNCIGSFLDPYSCDGDTGGWKPSGALSGQMKIADADHVPVTALGCKSLCSLLIGDKASVTSDKDGKLHCPVNPDGTYDQKYGDSCSTPGGTCKDSITLTAVFAAYGITIK
jgi:hypothetical protein